MYTIDRFKAARRAGVPIVAINTADPNNLLSRIVKVAADSEEQPPMIRWDAITGWTPLNNKGKEAIYDVFQEALQQQKLTRQDQVDQFIRKMTTNGGESLIWALELPERTMLFLVNPQRYLRDQAPTVAAFAQAICNVRDPYKETSRTLILIGNSAGSLPSELQGDTLVIEDPLPSVNELTMTMSDMLVGNDIAINDSDVAKAVDALRGLSPFAAEQAAALSLNSDGFQLDELWERKRKLIEQTPGLQVWKGGETFSDVAGVENIKKYASAILKGRSAPKVIVFIDEIEKAFAGAMGSGDSTGVSKAFLGKMLVEMQNTKAKGVIFIGPPGAAKSAIAKAIGAEAGILTIAFDLTSMKTSLLGESEERLTKALQVVDAVGDGNALYVATCNKIADLPPELKRRFKRGTFFFDLPTEAERKAIWTLYMKKYDLMEDESVLEIDDTDWTGAEIEQCCETAYDLNWSLKEASQFVVPVALSAKDQIAELRQLASGVFISASHPGVYQSYKASISEKPVAQARSRKIAQ